MFLKNFLDTLDGDGDCRFVELNKKSGFSSVYKYVHRLFVWNENHSVFY